jgi:serine/threonine protein kinase/Flp pilus assembly protein TadD
MTLAPQTRLGPYEVLGQLGAGGMGEVYRGRDARLGRDVAIKVLPERLAQDPQAAARFQREARAVAALSHPNIRAIYDVGTEGGRAYAVMEYLEGHTLAGRIRQSPLGWQQALEIAQKVAEGLAAAHARGVVHRDVKPENIFLTPDGGVKVLDFGLARVESPEVLPPPTGTTVSLQTQPGVILGTISYMAPEQVRGQPADARADVFALGCVLYEMLTGRPPFAGETSADVMAAILHDSPPPLSESGRDRPAELDRVVLRCLEKAPAQRWQSARDLGAALKGVAAGPPARRDTPRPAPAGASIAVLPFVNRSPDPDNEYFSDGLAEELIIALSKLERLHVAARTSSFAYKGKNEDVRQIGRQLNVQTVLEGSVRRAGNRLRVSVVLVSTADGYQLWSETYDRQMEDVFAIQDEITQSITRALRVILTEQDRRAIAEGPAATDVEAYDCYLRGRQLFHQFRRKGLEAARRHFGRAIEIDPGYARAHAGLADCCYFLYQNWDPDPANLAQADAASRKALELDPGLAEAHLSRGLVLSRTGAHEEACQEFETALRLDPRLFEAYYFFGRVCYARGDLAGAARLYEQACRLRPEDYQVPSLLGDVYRGLGRHADANTASLRACQLAERHLRLEPDDVRALSLMCATWLTVGDRARSRSWADRALALDPDDPVVLYNIACNYTLLGQPEEAIDCLEKAVGLGFTDRRWLEQDTDLISLRGHPRFQALLKRL